MAPQASVKNLNNVLQKCVAALGGSALFAMSFAAAADVIYPHTPKGAVHDIYHGTEIADPFRWLEDDNSPETKAWVIAQNAVTFAFLEKIHRRAAIRDRLTRLWNYERFGVPWKEGLLYFWMRNSGLQNQRVLYVADALDAEPRLLLDPNLLSSDGTVALTGTAVSDDGALLAYGLSRAGSDWMEWRVRDVRTGRDRDDLVEWVKFSGASWAKDGGGFYYSRFDAPKPGDQLTGVNEFQKLYFHKLGTPQREDKLIYERRDQKEWGFHGGVTDDGRYLLIGVTRGTDPKNAVFYRDLADTHGKVIELLPDFDADYSFIDNVGTLFLFSTDLDAPRSRVVVIDVSRPERQHWREIIPEAPESLKSVNFVGGQLLCTYLKDAHSVVRVFDGETAFRSSRQGEERHPSPNPATKRIIERTDANPLATEPKPLDDSSLSTGAVRARLLRELPLPGLGSVYGLGGKRSDTETFYMFTSFTMPETVYRLDIATGASSVFKQPKVDFNPADFETKQIFFQSKDGTRVPMFIAHKRGLKCDGHNPTILYGYGGFNVSLTPDFNVAELAWMEMGGVYAMPNLRGGGEYGSEWHRAGRKLKKQNVFDDFIAAAEWLIANGYTSTKNLAISGGSNGGLLVGACMTQRPELFAAALPAVGVMDMLRFHKFTIGWAWTSDYGSSDNADEFRALYAYSPLHNLRPGVRYPATLITTADHDDRVVPAHSFKFAARLQECQPPDSPPVLIRIETKAGHGSGTALNKLIDERADELAFAWHAVSGDSGETR